MITRPAIFQWRQTEPGLILCAVRWYLRYSLSLRDVEELLEERGLHVNHTTVWRWVGRWCYLYRAIDSAGATIDFLLSAFRDADAAKRLFRKALGDRSHPQPRGTNLENALVGYNPQQMTE